MELYNDLKFSGKGLNDIKNDDNIYTNKSIIFNNNSGFNIISEENKLNFNINPNSINFKYDKNLSFNNIFFISSNSNIGIKNNNPQFPLDVKGSISCIDINISNSILNKNIINNIGFSADNIISGILNINNGGTGKKFINDKQLIFGNEQSQFLIWNNENKQLTINFETSPSSIYNLDVNGEINSYYYRINDIDINNFFIKDFSPISNQYYINTSNMIYLSSRLYSYNNKFDLINIINSKTYDWIKNGKKINYINLNVGIGTIPKFSLDINGSINYTGNIRKNGVLVNLFYGDYIDLINNPGYMWNISNGHSFNLNKGCVGIGTTIPRYILDIDGDINFKLNLKKNSNIINFFDGNYNSLINKPLLSKIAYSSSYHDLLEFPNLFNGNYTNLKNIPTIFPTLWSNNISNLPIFFKTEWNNYIMNKPEYFNTEWNNYVINKPTYFDVNWNDIYGKPEFFKSDWNKTIINKPKYFDVDWNKDISNLPVFSQVAFTGDFSNIINKPYIFSGNYHDLINRPSFCNVVFTCNYYDLSNRPNVFSGDFDKLSNMPLSFTADWNTSLINKPFFSKVAFTGFYNDLNGNKYNWDVNNITKNIFTCNLVENIGIGLTNPSFKLHVQGLFNLNDTIKNDVEFSINGKKPYGIYLAENWSSIENKLYDLSGNERHANTYGNIIKENGNGNGANGENITYLKGNTSAYVNFPDNNIPEIYTILSITRYSGPTKARVLGSSNKNWLHGHHGTRRGVCHYDAWKTPYEFYGNTDDWLLCIGRNNYSTPNNIIVDGVGIGNNTGGVGNFTLTINNSYSEFSDWSFSCVFIWNIHLTDEECFKLNNLFQSFLNKGGSIKNLFSKNNINRQCYFEKNKLPYLTSNEFYITSNWKKNFNNIYNLNTGSIGINTNNPSSLYKLDVVNGIINTNNNLNINNTLNWSTNNSKIEINNVNIASDDPNYSYVFFANSGDIYFKNDLTCDILVVGGGGSGNRYYIASGGGGGGAVVYVKNALIKSGSYNIVVGDGGMNGNKGNNSSFANIIAEGGGGGGSTTNKRGGDGGSGAGSSSRYNISGGLVGTQSSLGGFTGTIYGNRGGLCETNANIGAGGGGANEIGSNGGTTTGGKGGDGIQINITGSK